MEEQAVKKRGWVKNAAIVFLSILLVLTFFSNTIMNRSLPEVATAYVESGTINAKIRGSGAVSAGESYDVVLSQTRKISSVHVKVGDTVETGDVLFLLAETDSDELTQAQDELDRLRLAYQEALLDQSGEDYASERRDIEKARQALADAKADRDAANISNETIYAAQTALKDAQRGQTTLEDSLNKIKEQRTEAIAQQKELEGNIKTWDSQTDALEREIDGYEEQIKDLKRSGSSNVSSRLESKREDLSDAKADYANKIVGCSAEFNSLHQQAQNMASSSEEKDILMQMRAILNTTSDETLVGKKSELEAVISLSQEIVTLEEEIASLEKQQSGQESVQQQIKELEDKLDEAEDKLDETDGDIRSAKRQLQTLTGTVEAADRDIQNLEVQIDYSKETVENLSEQYDQLKKQQESFDAAEEKVTTCQTNLDDLLFNLSEKQKADGKNAAKNQLELEDQRKKLEKQETLVKELRENASGVEVKAPVSGTISSISAVAGRDTTANEAMATIEVTDRGYTVRFAVTNDQSKKVRIGDKADVTNYYWGNSIDATLTQIVNDPQNPGKGKLLVFTITGEVTSGQNLTLSVGEKSATYDAIIPNSALRKDTNGDFVLVVTAKSSPLGNRYIATRADVQILAQDDTTAAVSGLSSGDYVITTSSKPLEAGMQVNMEANG